MIDKNIERGVYDPAILEYYNDEEIARMDPHIHQHHDEKFIHAGLGAGSRQISFAIDANQI